MGNLDKFQVQEPRLAPITPKENLENFSSLSIKDVCKVVRESSNASCRLDPVPTWLVKSCLDVLAPPITEIFNLSLLSSCVPENWRTAVVIPALKKPGLYLVYKNFRPVSNLLFISKVVEKAALQQRLVSTLIHAFVSSHLDYCNALLFGLPKYQLDTEIPECRG